MNLETYLKELGGESDRACALIAGAAISDALCDLLKLYFVTLEETDIERLFYERGVLGDFAGRTDVSFALGLISPQERLVANVIRRIRNQFAHTLAQFDFSHELIISELKKIGKPLSDKETKSSFVKIFMALYLALRARSMYITKQRSGLAGGKPVPIYELSKQKRSHGMVTPG